MKTTEPGQALQQVLDDQGLSHIFDASLVVHLRLHHFDAHEQIITKGSKVHYLYLVIKGEAGVVPASSDGKIGILDTIMPMDIVGDLEYFSNATYYHGVVAMTPCEYLAIPIHIIPTHFNHNIDFYKFICENMANKMQRTSKRYSRALLYPLKNLLAKYLYDQCQEQASKDLIISTTVTSEFFGVSARHLRRVIAEMVEEGILTRNKSSLHIIDIDQLRTHALDS